MSSRKYRFTNIMYLKSVDVAYFLSNLSNSSLVEVTVIKEGLKIF